MIDEIKEEQNAINFDKLLYEKTHFNFGIFKSPQNFTSDIYYKGSLKDAKDDQYKFVYFTEWFMKLQSNKSSQNKGQKGNIN